MKRSRWSGRRPLRVALLALWLLAAPMAGQTGSLPPIPVDTFTLANGLEVIVSEDRSAQVVAVQLWLHAGSADDPAGRAGLARLVQSRLAATTVSLAPGEPARLVEEAGGTSGAFTTHDVTGFWEVVPSHRVNLAIWLQAERLRAGGLTAEGLRRAQEALATELSQRHEGQPYSRVQLALDSVATDYGPYRHPVMGRSEELADLTVEEARVFHERAYAPSNAVLAVVGDVGVPEVRRFAEEYLDDIRRRDGGFTRPPAPPTPRFDGERRARVEDVFARVPVVYVAYTVPPANHPDVYPLALLSRILSTGESSRLHRRLVTERKVAPVVFSGLNLRTGSGLFLVGSLPLPAVDLDRVEAVLDQEIDRIRVEGATAAELEKARNQVRAAEVAARLSVKGKADALLRFRFQHGDAAAVNEEMGRYWSVTVADLDRVARTYLARDNRTVIVGRPPSSSPSASGARP